METILQGLLDMPGVNAAILFDGAGRLLAHRGRSVYDRALCEQVGGPLARAVDSLQLQHEDWESASAQFADGTLLLRRLDTTSAGPCVLAAGGRRHAQPGLRHRGHPRLLHQAEAGPRRRRLVVRGRHRRRVVGRLAPGLPAAPGPGGSQVGHPAAGLAGRCWPAPA